MNDKGFTWFKRLCHVSSFQKADLFLKQTASKTLDYWVSCSCRPTEAWPRQIFTCLAEVPLPDHSSFLWKIIDRQRNPSLGNPFFFFFFLAQESRSCQWGEREFGVDSVCHMQHHLKVSAEELYAFQANILEKQHGALGEAESPCISNRIFTHNPEDGGIKKVITCVSIEIPA